MTKIKNGDFVRVHYTGKLDNGETFDSSEGREPLAFIAGAEMLIKGFDDAVMDKEAGDKINVKIAPEDAYGDWDPENVFTFPIEHVPSDIVLEKGLELQLSGPHGEVIPVVITEFDDKNVKMDSNHVLAGKTLVFDIEIVDINNEEERAAFEQSMEEMHSHHHGCGCGCEDDDCDCDDDCDDEGCDCGHDGCCH